MSKAPKLKEADEAWIEIAMAIHCTVLEAKSRLTYAEALQWMAYRAKHGGIGETRTVYLLGTLCTMFNNVNGGKATLQDFLPGLPAPAKNEISDAEALWDFFVRTGA